MSMLSEKNMSDIWITKVCEDALMLKKPWMNHHIMITMGATEHLKVRGLDWKKDDQLFGPIKEIRSSCCYSSVQVTRGVLLVFNDALQGSKKIRIKKGRFGWIDTVFVNCGTLSLTSTLRTPCDSFSFWSQCHVSYAGRKE